MSKSPGVTETLALLDAPIPGIGEAWPQIYNDPRLWHFHFVYSTFSLPLVLGLEPKELALLAVTFLVSSVTLGSGRTHMMQGAVHLVMFAAFLFLALFP